MVLEVLPSLVFNTSNTLNLTHVSCQQSKQHSWEKLLLTRCLYSQNDKGGKNFGCRLKSKSRGELYIKLESKWLNQEKNSFHEEHWNATIIKYRSIWMIQHKHSQHKQKTHN